MVLGGGKLQRWLWRVGSFRRDTLVSGVNALKNTNCMALSYIFEDVHKARSSRTKTEVARCSPKGWGNIFFVVGSLNLFAGVTAALLPTHSSISLVFSTFWLLRLLRRLRPFSDFGPFWHFGRGFWKTSRHNLQLSLNAPSCQDQFIVFLRPIVMVRFVMKSVAHNFYRRPA